MNRDYLLSVIPVTVQGAMEQSIREIGVSAGASASLKADAPERVETANGKSSTKDQNHGGEYLVFYKFSFVWVVVRVYVHFKAKRTK